MPEAILVTSAEFATIMWLLAEVAILHVAIVTFRAPHEKDEQ